MPTVLHLGAALAGDGGAPLSLWHTACALRDHTPWQPLILAGRFDGLRPLPGVEEDRTVPRWLLPVWQPLGSRGGAAVAYPRGYVATLRRLAAQADLVHIHSLWMFPTLIGCPLLRSLGKPFIIAPRGTLEPWALAHRGWKKRLVFWLAERRNLESAACLHATSDQERESLRWLGLKAAVAVIPNGLHSGLEAYVQRGGRHRRPAPPERTLLFVSRLHPKKRVVELVRTFARLSADFPAWRLRIVGGEDHPGYERLVRRAAEQAGLGARVCLAGHLAGDELWAAYQAADLFVLPTMSENLGNVVVEALAAGLPVVTTRGAPWHELETEGCGWWVDLDMAACEAALRQAMQLPAATRWEMGRRGQALVRRRYTWRAVARSLAGLYDGILHENPVALPTLRA